MGEGYWPEFCNMLTDADDLEDYLKENRLRPDDVKYEAADRGTEAHAVLEDLAELFLRGGEAVAQKKAAKILSTEKSSPYAKGVAGWWLDTNPHVEASEEVLISLKHEFAGTCDLIWWDWEGNLVCTDLKSRKAGSAIYESDDVQTAAYEIAWNERNDKNIDRRTVLLTMDDGTFKEGPATIDPQVFLDLLAVYRGLRA
jgi:hypothetical protein